MQASKYGKKSDSHDEYTGSITGSYVPRANDPGDITRSGGFGLEKLPIPDDGSAPKDFDDIVDSMIFGDSFDGMDEVIDAVNNVKRQVILVSKGMEPSAEIVEESLFRIADSRPDVAAQTSEMILLQTQELVGEENPAPNLAGIESLRNLAQTFIEKLS